MPKMPLINPLKFQIYPFLHCFFHILLSLKKFCPWNLKYRTSTNQTNKILPSLKFSSCISVPIVLNAKSITSCLGTPWEIIQSQIPSRLFTWKGHIILKYPLAITSHHQWDIPFFLTFHHLRSIMICLFDPAQYQGNLYSHHTRPYTKSYLSSCGNYHRKDTSLITGDQTQLSPKTRESHHPSMSTKI